MFVCLLKTSKRSKFHRRSQKETLQMKLGKGVHTFFFCFCFCFSISTKQYETKQNKNNCLHLESPLASLSLVMRCVEETLHLSPSSPQELMEVGQYCFTEPITRYRERKRKTIPPKLNRTPAAVSPPHSHALGGLSAPVVTLGRQGLSQTPHIHATLPCDLTGRLK